MRSAIILAGSIAAILFVSCCPDPPAVNPAKALPLNSTIDLSDFNSRAIYSMITVEPADKPEKNGSLSNDDNHAGSLATTKSAVNGVAASIAAEDIAAGASTASGNPARGGRQAECDDRMRAAENEALTNRSRQFSRKANLAMAPITIGSAWTGINVLDFSTTPESWKSINATCRAISDHAYIYVEDGYESSVTDRLASYSTAFDGIYNVNRAKFGDENDVDGNGKVIILFSHSITDGALGYFNSDDKFDNNTTTNPYSNDGDIFYITADTAYQGDYVLGTLAHEFQHMIYFDQHYNRSVTSTYTWLNEALSQAAEYFNGYTANHMDWIRSFLASDWYYLSLTYWTSSNYGYGAVFIRYLIDQYGDAIAKSLCSTDKVGVAAVEAATGADFNAVFHNFSRAIVLSGTGASTDKSDNFSTLDLRAAQPTGRRGLLPDSSALNAGTNYTINWPPYNLLFFSWSGYFGTMTLSGASYAGTAFGLVE